MAMQWKSYRKLEYRKVKNEAFGRYTGILRHKGKQKQEVGPRAYFSPKGICRI
jgi:hypothetical protein